MDSDQLDIVNDQGEIIGQASRGEIKLDEEENDQYQWLTLDELEKLEDVDVYFKELLDSKLIKRTAEN